MLYSTSRGKDFLTTFSFCETGVDHQIPTLELGNTGKVFLRIILFHLESYSSKTIFNNFCKIANKLEYEAFSDKYQTSDPD